MKECIYYASAILTAILLIIGSIRYVKETKASEQLNSEDEEDNRPNLLVIGIWVLIGIAMAYIYTVVVYEDWFKAVLVIVGAIMNIYVMHAIIKGGNYILLRRDFFIFGACAFLMVFLCWKLEIKDMYVLLQIANIISYFPLVTGILDRKGKEPLKPWIIITLASVTNIVTVSVSYSDSWSLFHPIRSLVFQIFVIILIIIKLPRATSS